MKEEKEFQCQIYYQTIGINNERWSSISEVNSRLAAEAYCRRLWNYGDWKDWWDEIIIAVKDENSISLWRVEAVHLVQFCGVKDEQEIKYGR